MGRNSLIPEHLSRIPGVEQMPMFYIKDHTETCKCGRDTVRLHCPACGSTNLWGLAKRASVRTVFGQSMICNGYRCRRCYYTFDEADCLQCEAPTFRFKNIQERRDYDKAQERLEKLAGTQEERLETITEVLKLIPPKPKKEPSNGGE